MRDEVVQPPAGPSGRNGVYDRPPPTGPSRTFTQSQPSPPTGPSRSRPTPTGPSRDFTSPPLRGRGSLTYRARGGPAYGRGDYISSRGDYGGGGGIGIGSGASSSSGGMTRSERDPPTGPRGDFSRSESYRGGYGRGATGAAGSAVSPVTPTGPSSDQQPQFGFRGSTGGSATYPRTQRFNSIQQHLSTTEKLVPGGKLLPSGLPLDQEKRLKTLEAEAERMRVEIAEKQRLKREMLNDWDVRTRETERDTLRSELADSHLQTLIDGDDGIGRAAF